MSCAVSYACDGECSNVVGSLSDMDRPGCAEAGADVEEWISPVTKKRRRAILMHYWGEYGQ